MTTNETLTRRWLASKHWGGWRVGMVDTCGRVNVAPSGMDALGESMGLPDLDHPGTRAFLLEDVRRAWGDAVYWMSGPGGHHVVKCGYQWFNEGKRVGNGLTEAEALVAALEAAPGE